MCIHSHSVCSVSQTWCVFLSSPYPENIPSACKCINAEPTTNNRSCAVLLCLSPFLVHDSCIGYRVLYKYTSSCNCPVVYLQSSFDSPF